MPVYNVRLTDIDTVETKRYAGLRNVRNFDEKKLLDACEEAQILLETQGSWFFYDYDYKNQTILSEIPVIISGKSISRHLENCDKVICMAVTIGESIETEITNKFDRGEYIASILLDAAATTAVEQAADAIEKKIKQDISSKGYSMRWRFSPGYDDWSLSQQLEIYNLSGAESIGIRLSDSMMMIPRKSITALIGLYKKEVNDKYIEVKNKCKNCNKNNCPNRQQ